MTFETVVHNGTFTFWERIWNLMAAPWPSGQWITAVLTGSTVGIILFSLLSMYVFKVDEGWKAKLTVIMAMVVSVVGSFALFGGYYEKGPLMTAWKEDSLRPYMETLDTKRMDVTNVRMLQKAGNRYFAAVDEKALRPVQVTYINKKGKEVVYESMAIVKKGKGSSYMEYQLLPDTVNGIKKGMINPVLYVTN